MAHAPSAVPSQSAMPLAVAALFERQDRHAAVEIAARWALAWEAVGQPGLAQAIADATHAEVALRATQH